MKQVIAALLTGFGLFLAFQPQAEAHGLGKVVVVHDGRVVRKFRPAYPHWLRAERDFHRWYRHSRYHRLRHPDWHRLYGLYRQEVRYHRHIRHNHRHRHGRGCRYL